MADELQIAEEVFEKILIESENIELINAWADLKKIIVERFSNED